MYAQIIALKVELMGLIEIYTRATGFIILLFSAQCSLDTRSTTAIRTCFRFLFFLSPRLSLIAVLGVFYGLLLYPQVRGNTCNVGLRFVFTTRRLLPGR